MVLVPNNTESETTGSLQFVEAYRTRFGEPCPLFFTGSLEDALKEACHKPAREVMTSKTLNVCKHEFIYIFFC